MNSVDLASLLCSRLCHDLMSPVGALNNGIELLADETDPTCARNASSCSPTALGRRRTSSNSSGSRSGPAAVSATRSTRREARAALEGLFGGEGKIELGWVVEDEKLPKGAIKLLLNLALLAGDALVRGGRLDVGAESAATARSSLRSAPKGRASCSTRCFARRSRPAAAEAIEPRAAGAWLAHSLAAEAGGTIQLSDPVERRADDRSDASRTGITAR